MMMMIVVVAATTTVMTTMITDDDGAIRCQYLGRGVVGTEKETAQASSGVGELWSIPLLI